MLTKSSASMKIICGLELEACVVKLKTDNICRHASRSRSIAQKIQEAVQLFRSSSVDHRQIRANFRQMCNLSQFDKRCKIMDKKEVVDLVTSSPMLISHATFLLCQGWERPKKNLPFLHFFKRVVLKCALKVKHLPSLRFTYWVLKLLIVEFVGKNDP